MDKIIQVSSGRLAQANITRFLAAWCGEKIPPVCPDCGGVISDFGALAGQCICAKEHENKMD